MLHIQNFLVQLLHLKIMRCKFLFQISSLIFRFVNLNIPRRNDVLGNNRLLLEVLELFFHLFNLVRHILELRLFHVQRIYVLVNGLLSIDQELVHFLNLLLSGLNLVRLNFVFSSNLVFVRSFFDDIPVDSRNFVLKMLAF